MRSLKEVFGRNIQCTTLAPSRPVEGTDWARHPSQVVDRVGFILEFKVPERADFKALEAQDVLDEWVQEFNEERN